MTLQNAELAMIEREQTDVAETSVDAFHNGSFKVIQPVKAGHRSGLDALLLAAALPKDANGLLADLGSGAGVAGLAALSLNPKLELLSVEKNAKMAGLARKSLNLAENRDLAKRVKIIEADVTSNGKTREAAGLKPECASHVIMNPPYNPMTLRAPPDPMKAEAYVMGNGGLEAWFRTAASILEPGGTMTIIYRTEQLGDIIACTRGRFGGLEFLPLHSRANEPAKRLIVRGTRGSRAPLAVLPGFVIHNDDGSFTTAAQDIFNGEGFLEFFN